MRIRILENSINQSFNFVDQNQALDNIESNVSAHNAPKNKLQKLIKINKKSVQGEELKALSKSIDKFDPKGLTKNFLSVLAARIQQKGWDKNDVFIKWLLKADDNNIKALDASSAQALIKLLERKDLKPTDPHIIEDNNLFSGSSKDIIYKLNALSMLSDPGTAKKYKNSTGEIPDISLMFVDKNVNNNFLDTRSIKIALEDFSSDEDKENLITLEKWLVDISGWQVKDIPNQFYKLIDKVYATDKKSANAWTNKFKYLFSDNGKKERDKLFDNCEVSKSIGPDQLDKLWNSILEYFKKRLSNQSFQTSRGAKIAPNTVFTVKDALEAKGLTVESGYRTLGASLNKIVDPDKKSSFIKAFNKMWKSERFRNDFLKSKIKTTSTGALPWARHIQNYILSIPSLNDEGNPN